MLSTSQPMETAYEGMPRRPVKLLMATSALSRVESGDRDGFTRPLANSYHDIWMELHEDLLTGLKLARTAADA